MVMALSDGSPGIAMAQTNGNHPCSVWLNWFILFVSCLFFMHTAILATEVFHQLKKKANCHCKQKPATSGGQGRKVRPRLAPSEALCHIQPPTARNTGTSQATVCIFSLAPFVSQCCGYCIIDVRREDGGRLSSISILAALAWLKI